LFCHELGCKKYKKNYQKHLKHDSSHIWVVVTENWLHVNMNGIYEQDTCLLTSSKMHKTALTLEDLKKNYRFSTKMSLVQFIYCSRQMNTNHKSKKVRVHMRVNHYFNEVINIHLSLLICLERKQKYGPMLPYFIWKFFSKQSLFWFIKYYVLNKLYT
jgi:hypothetical protein